MKVNRLEQSVCGLPTIVLRGKSITAHNIRLNEIKKKALFVNQTVVLLSTIFGKRTVVVLNPSCFTSLIPSSLAVILKHPCWAKFRTEEHGNSQLRPQNASPTPGAAGGGG